MINVSLKQHIIFLIKKYNVTINKFTIKYF